MRLSTHAFLVALLAILTPGALAQTIVTDGDDLVAIVAAATSGDVIQIDSNATFHGTIVPSGKTLTIEAGSGFAPTLKGSANDNCVRVLPTLAGTNTTLRGLRLEAGDGAVGPGPWPSLVLQSSGTVAYSADLFVEDCVIEGIVVIFGNYHADCDVTLLNTVLEDNMNLFGTYTTPVDIEVIGCEIAGPVVATCSPHLGIPRLMDLKFVRTLFRKEVGLNASGGATLNVEMDSCIVDGSMSSPTPPFGIRVYADTNGTIANTTVTGCTNGIQGQPGVSWHNMLISDNVTDLVNVLPGEIEYSLIEDGTYDGVDNNFGGTALFDGSWALLACSPGVDAGSNAAPLLGAVDFSGGPRILDNDADGTATVNVGAVEHTGSIAGSAVVFNGTNVNPLDYTTVSIPTAGETFHSYVNPAPGTIVTVVVLDTQAGPFTGPDWTGELLLALSGTEVYDFGLGPHAMAVPLDCSLVGLTVASQGFRIDSVNAVISYHCLNGLDLTIGG
ncbi:MAG: hypothetical protein P1V81_15140 [Planctomycetota bacterium]|nr:hypothetical protein [Planctomycetota bacterium]